MEMTKELNEAVAKQEETVHEMGKQMVEIKEQITEKLQRVREELETIATNATDGSQRSYADVTRLTPFMPQRLPEPQPRPLTRTPWTRPAARLTIQEQKMMPGP
jgi:uncharacterized coiled-coil protein SlyX